MVVAAIAAFPYEPLRLCELLLSAILFKERATTLMNEEAVFNVIFINGHRLIASSP